MRQEWQTAHDPVRVITVKTTAITLTGLGDEAQTHGRWDGQSMHDAGDGFIGWIGHGSWIKYANVDLREGITGATLSYASGWTAEPRTVELWVAPVGSRRPDNGELAAIIHVDDSTGSYEAASAVTAEAMSVARTPGGSHDVYILFRGHEFNYGALGLTLALPAPPSPPKPAHDGVPPRPSRTQSPRSRTPDQHMTLVQGAQVFPQIAWPTNPRAQVRWSSSKRSVATVSPQGKVTAVTPGTATITVKSQATEVTFKIRVVAKKPHSAG
jgi:hypothetical protein